MSVSEGTRRPGLSRRSVVKGAAWAVPAVAVASAAPALAASQGLISFSGRACKLPGNSSDTFKGYVFELIGNNDEGRNPWDAVTVVTSVSVDGIADTGPYAVEVKTNGGTCSCGTCGSAPATQQFCTPDNTHNQQILLYTTADVTGSSSNTPVSITIDIYDCNKTDSCGEPKTFTLSTSFNSTPTAQEGGGGNCTIPNIFPLPS